MLKSLFIVLIAAFAALCRAEGKEGPVNVAQGNNEFAATLYGQVATQGQNCFFSPASISTALAMTALGARGQTQQQMYAALGAGGEAADQFQQGYGQLVKRLNEGGKDRGYELSVANRLWGQKGLPFAPEFLQKSQQLYGAGLEDLDFAANAESSRSTINQWVSDQTHGKIKDLIPKGGLSSLSRLVLTNAIYFKGAWSAPFEARATSDQDFAAPGGPVKVPMMHRRGGYLYGEDELAQCLELPYRSNELAMLIVLPRKVDGLAAVEKRLTERGGANEVIRQMHHRGQVDLWLPRFTMRSSFELKSALSALGMSLAFDPEHADFSGMSTAEKIAISAAFHQAFVDVNEQGTEAAAATGIVMGVTAARPEQPVTFRADHPFLFLIRDVKSGAILFMGKLVSPKS